MLYGISTGFGSPQMPVAELLARGLPSLPSQQQQKAKSSNFLQVPDIETPRSVFFPSTKKLKIPCWLRNTRICVSSANDNCSRIKTLYRAKSVPSSPMMRRAFTRLGTITAGWSKSIRKQQNLSADDKKKWASSQDFSRKYINKHVRRSRDSSLLLNLNR